jgi:hypothetical protein
MLFPEHYEVVYAERRNSVEKRFSAAGMYVCIYVCMYVCMLYMFEYVLCMYTYMFTYVWGIYACLVVYIERAMHQYTL